jgi:Uncharacterized conserved protein
MSRFYDIDDANATLAELGPMLSTLIDQRAELVRLRDHILAHDAAGPGPAGDDGEVGAAVANDLRFTRLRMLGLIDQMAAGVARIDELGIALRDIPTGLVDFPALVNGRQVWLCWRRDEPTVLFWHRQDQGFDSRRSIADLEGTGRTA